MPGNCVCWTSLSDHEVAMTQNNYVSFINMSEMWYQFICQFHLSFQVPEILTGEISVFNHTHYLLVKFHHYFSPAVVNDQRVA